MAGLELSSKKKVAFVCSGGAVKAAAFHFGVALALEQKGFRFSGGTREGLAEDTPTDPSKTIRVYVGSSAGSLVATLLSQGGKLKDLQGSFERVEGSSIPGIKYWEMLFPRLSSAKDLFGLENFILDAFKHRSIQSPFSTNGIARYLRSHVIRTDRFSDLEPDLFIVATELNQSRKVVFGKYKSAPVAAYLEYRNDVSVSDACAASMALPPVYHPYSIQIGREKRDYFDGEIREPLSEHVARDIGCDLIICSYTHQPIRFPSDKGTLASKGINQVTLQAIYQAIEQKIYSSRSARLRERNVIDRVRKFFRDRQLPENLCDELIADLEVRMTYKSQVDYIYIHPRSSDLDMFLSPHFSLDKSKTERIAKKGYLAAMTALRGLRLD